MPSKAGSSAEGPILNLPYLSFDDEGLYECEAYNSEGSDTYQGRINVQGKEKILCQAVLIAALHIVQGQSVRFYSLLQTQSDVYVTMLMVH